MRRKQLLALTMLVAGLAFLAAAFAVGGQGAAKRAGSAEALKGGTLRVNQNSADFDFTDPHIAYRTDDWEMLFATSMHLVAFPEKAGAAGSQLSPEAATAFPSVSKDGKTYTFHIRPGLRFSDGSKVTGGSFQRPSERGPP